MPVASSLLALFSGLLCTIDLRNDPVTMSEALAAFQPPGIDFLLPHGIWAAADSPLVLVAANVYPEPG